MTDQLYLNQSRRLAKIIRSLIGKSYWTNYIGWEYSFKGIDLDLKYVSEFSEIKRFTFVVGHSRELLLKTDSIKEAVKFIKERES